MVGRSIQYACELKSLYNCIQLTKSPVIIYIPIIVYALVVINGRFSCFFRRIISVSISLIYENDLVLSPILMLGTSQHRAPRSIECKPTSVFVILHNQAGSSTIEPWNIQIRRGSMPGQQLCEWERILLISGISGILGDHTKVLWYVRQLALQTISSMYKIKDGNRRIRVLLVNRPHIQTVTVLRSSI